MCPVPRALQITGNTEFIMTFTCWAPFFLEELETVCVQSVLCNAVSEGKPVYPAEQESKHRTFHQLPGGDV